mmetsp:Transcript_19095/g.29553  ORF Transcript_19095/g.29553 Transcript_19095/m.29553 type:complete len:224 (-) Transcript_19095:16-687(-)
MARKAGSLVIFDVDASGSMALNRMNMAKGAAVSLLTESYKNRDKICLIYFSGDQAEVLVPPTKSIALTKHRLESMPCGGGSPLAHSLALVIRTGVNAKKSKDVGKIVVVLITDGRANIPLCVSYGDEFDPAITGSASSESPTSIAPNRMYLKDEVLCLAKKLGALPDFDCLVIDTEHKYLSTGLAKDVAQAACGNYYQIDQSDTRAVAAITKKNLEAARKHTF